MEQQNRKGKDKEDDEILPESPGPHLDAEIIADLQVAASGVIVHSTFLNAPDNQIPTIVLDLNAPVVDALGPVEHSQTVPKVRSRFSASRLR